MARTLQIGDTLEGKYEVLRKIGEGGMGEVYEGRHVALEMRVAIKVLRPFGKDNDAEMRSRFKGEAQSAASIKHPNVVEVRDFGFTPDDRPFFVMKYMEGESLANLLDRQKVLDPGRMVEIVSQILSGLGRAHKNEIVHRDLKPGNIFLAKDEDGKEIVKILDFGISKMVSTDDPADSAGFRTGNSPAGENGRMNTEMGEVLGTPGYVAPESITKQGTIDHRVDLFAVGVLVFEMLIGQRPFRGTNAQEILVNTAQNPVPNLRELNPRVSSEMESMCLMALAKDPDERFHSAAEFNEYLDAAAQGRTPENSRDATAKVGLPAHFQQAVKAAREKNAAKRISTSSDEKSLELDLRDVENPENFDNRRSSVAGHPATVAAAVIIDAAGNPSRQSGIPTPARHPGMEIPGLAQPNRDITTPEMAYMASPKPRRFPLSSIQFKLLVGLIVIGLATLLVAGTTLLENKSTNESAGNLKTGAGDDINPQTTSQTPSVSTPLKLPPTVAIWLDITPSDAKVHWNGELMVGNPLRVAFSDRPAKVEVTKAGFKRKVLVVTPDAEQTVQATLQEEEAKQSRDNAKVKKKRKGKKRKARTKKGRKNKKRKARAKNRRAKKNKRKSVTPR